MNHLGQSETSDQRVAYGYLMEQIERTQARYDELWSAAREVVNAEAGMAVDGHSPFIAAENRRGLAIQRLKEILDA